MGNEEWGMGSERGEVVMNGHERAWQGKPQGKLSELG